jgi:uncharacterized protein YbjT (DUF2867 family)
MEKRTAIIAGASGLVGKFCLSYLMMDNVYEKIIVITRKELSIKDPKVEQLIVDFDRLEDYKEQLKADDIFCCLGTTIRVAGTQENFRKVDEHYPLKLAEHTSKNGAKNFMIISAMGADANSSIFYNRVKGEMENELKKIPFESVHIFRPSLLTGMRKESRPMEQMAQRVMSIFSALFIGSLKKYRSIDAMVVAHAMITRAKENAKGIFIYSSDQIQLIFDKRAIS